MKADNKIVPPLKELRKHAEKILRQNPRSIPAVDIKKLIHELDVHQIELQIQDEQLRNNQVEIEALLLKYYDLYILAPVGYFTFDRNDLILEANTIGINLLGAEKRNLNKKKFSHFISPDSQDDYYFHKQRVFETGNKQACELKLIKRDGTPFYGHVESVAVQNTEGSYEQIRSALVDISARKQAEQELLNHRERLACLVEERTAELRTVNNLLKQEIDERKRAEASLQKQTHALEKRVKELKCLYGISDIVEKSDLSTEEILQEIVDLIPLSWQYPEASCARIIFRDKEYRTKNFKNTVWKQTSEIAVYCEQAGTLEVCYLAEKPVIDEGPFLKEERALIDAVACRLGNILERRNAQLSLKKSYDQFITVLNGLDVYVYVADMETYEILFINKAAIDKWGEVTGKICWKNLQANQASPCEFCTNKKLVDDKGDPAGVHIWEYKNTFDNQWYECHDQVIRWIDGRLVRIQIATNTTLRKFTEKELLKSKKLEATGILAGGIAHDFNNLLCAIIGNIDLAKNDLQDSDKNIKFLANAEKASLRARDLINKFMTFSSGGAPTKATTSIRQLIIDTADVALSGSSSKCEYCISDDLWQANIDREQMAQAVRNIVDNAKESMPDGGTIRISIKNISISGEHDADGFVIQKGNYIRICIADHGSGITENEMPNIFDLYFSTKTLGSQKGMGLGLSITYSTIKNHGGYINVESAPGKGTDVYIYLPVSLEQQLKQEVKRTETSKSIAAFAGKKRILFMDDEEMLRDLAFEILTSMGHEAEISCHGEDAIQKYTQAQESGHPFDAVILDLTIKGGMGGMNTIKKLKEIDPEVIAVVASGYSADPVMSDFEKYGFKGAIPKPFNLDQLEALLRSVLLSRN